MRSHVIIDIRRSTVRGNVDGVHSGNSLRIPAPYCSMPNKTAGKWVAYGNCNHSVGCAILYFKPQRVFDQLNSRDVHLRILGRL